MFIWGAVFWMSPLGLMAVSAVEDESALSAAMMASLPESGIYFVPDAAAMETDAEGWTARHEAGPLATIIFHREGFAPMQAGIMIKGFLHELVSIAFMAMLLRCFSASPALNRYSGRAMAVLMLGILMGFYSRLGDSIWFLHPIGWGLTNWAYTVGAWGLAGLVLAAFIKPRTEA